MIVVSAHQPNFAPWLGFFDKMAHSDILVLLDTVQFTKRGYQNRTLIKGPQGPQWLTVPVLTKGRYQQLTRNVMIDESSDWRQVHLRTLQEVSARTPHRTELWDCVEPVYRRTDIHHLVEHNLELITRIVRRLGISTRLVLASELDVEGSASRLMVNLTKAVGGDMYLSGPTGRKYLEPELFSASGVELRYHEFHTFEYPQQFGAFVPGLSCLDYITNMGFTPFEVNSAGPPTAVPRQWGRSL